MVSAFMNDPDVLILDEPTSGLDPVMQNVFIDYIRNEKKKGKTILLSSHIFSEVDATCDRIAIIKDGKIVSDFVADDLRHASQKNYSLTFSRPIDFEGFLSTCEEGKKPHDLKKAMGNMMDYCRKDLKVIVSVNDADINELVSRLCDFPVCGFVHLKETLEDYFMKYYKEEKDFGGAFAK